VQIQCRNLLVGTCQDGDATSTPNGSPSIVVRRLVKEGCSERSNQVPPFGCERSEHPGVLQATTNSLQHA
jgi:hypothetical protein